MRNNDDREERVSAITRLLLDKAPDLFALGIDAATIIALLKRPEIREVVTVENRSMAYERGYCDGRHARVAEEKDRILDRLEEIIREIRTDA